jgi:hypothetical protein
VDPSLFNHIDNFLSQSRGNGYVGDVFLFPYSFDGQSDDCWDKVGEAVENLQALKNLHISTRSQYSDDDDGDDQVPIPDWEIVASILLHVRQKVNLDISEYHRWATEEVQPFARAIRWHPSFDGGRNFPYEFVDTLYSTLATLPALESITCYNWARAEDESTLTNLKSLTELLRVPTLRFVHFRWFSFTPAFCQAAANVLIEGTAITNIKFSICEFSDGECATIMANGLTRNTSVISISVIFPFTEALVSVLAAALPSNSTLQELSSSGKQYDYGPDLSPFILALEKNMALKSLLVHVARSIDDDELLCRAMKNGLRMNSTLEISALSITPLCGAGPSPFFAPTRLSSPCRLP